MSRCRESLAKWPVTPQTKHWHSSHWKWLITCIICRLSPSNWSNLGGSPTSASGLGGNKSSFLSMTTLPAGMGYLLYLSIGICGSCSSPLEVGRLISLHLPCLHVEGVKAGIHLFPLGEICHHKTQCIAKVGQKSIIEPVPPQILSLIGHTLWMSLAEDGHCLMDP